MDWWVLVTKTRATDWFTSETVGHLIGNCAAGMQEKAAQWFIWFRLKFNGPMNGTVEQRIYTYVPGTVRQWTIWLFFATMLNQNTLTWLLHYYVCLVKVYSHIKSDCGVIKCPRYISFTNRLCPPFVLQKRFYFAVTSILYSMKTHALFIYWRKLVTFQKNSKLWFSGRIGDCKDPSGQFSEEWQSTVSIPL